MIRLEWPQTAISFTGARSQPSLSRLHEHRMCSEQTFVNIQDRQWRYLTIK
jgi:hypothetical protein